MYVYSGGIMFLSEVLELDNFVSNEILRNQQQLEEWSGVQKNGLFVPSFLFFFSGCMYV